MRPSRRRAGDRRCGTRWAGRCSAALRRGGGLRVVRGSRAPAGDVLLVLAAGARLSAYIGATVGEIGFLRGFWMDGSRRLAWLEDYAASLVARPICPLPALLHAGIRLEHVSFAYPGTVARSSSTTCRSRCPPARSSPSSARTAPARRRWSSCSRRCTSRRPAPILVDDTPLARIRADSGARAWPARSRTSSASSSARATPWASATSRVWTTGRRSSTAVERAGAADVVARLKTGLETQLGPTWPGGVEVSFGQWQKLALARGFMRDRPLLLVLDEPTAALDAETEHALFERYAAAARARGRRIARRPDASRARVPPLLDRAHGRPDRRAGRRTRWSRSGTHEALMAKGGQYAELYGIQAAAYR